MDSGDIAKGSWLLRALEEHADNLASIAPAAPFVAISREAAATLRTQAAEIERLRAALTKIGNSGGCCVESAEMRHTALAALDALKASKGGT